MASVPIDDQTSSDTKKSQQQSTYLLGGMSSLENATGPAEPETVVDAMKAVSLIQGIVGARPGADFQQAIKLALETLKHDGSCQVGSLVDYGAPLVLTRCLARSLSETSRLKEVPDICEFLLVLFRSSAYFATKALQQIVGELFPLLLCILNLRQSMSGWEIPPEVMRLIDRVSALPIQLDHVDDRMYLLSIFREAILMACIDVAEKNTLTGLFQLLTGLVLSASSRQEFFADPSLFELILTNYHHLRKANYHLAAFLLVASQDAESRKRMINCPVFFKALSTLLRENEPETRKVAIAMAKLVATDKVGRIKMITLGGPTLFDAIFENARSKELSDRCLELLHQLICSDTARLFHEDDKLLLPLLEAKHLDEESDIIVAEIIYQISAILSAHAKGMSRFLDSILQICSPGKKTEVRTMGAKSLLRQSQTEACNFFLLRTPAAVVVIASLASDDDLEVRGYGTKIIGNFASNPLNHRILTRNTSLIEPLTTAVEQHASKVALQALLKLADNSKCNQALAKHNNVVASLSKYGVLPSESNKELQHGALHRVVKLVTLM
ncbi:hypothetical protein IV203_026730 [Nitzschia inconspicua]|uniref:Uncharacterized protein n=1 Tax=Nitzschia inconspicua TaxID=303405 RepID=A0A9K3PXM3_9STRA|nr:hypothetical protein IV203_026730 [Nitzschia inconspicua]